MERTVDLVNKEMRDQIVEFCRAGRAVKVEGLGIFTPTIDLDGTLAISFRADSAMNYGLNVPGTFSGTIINRECRSASALARPAMNSSPNGTKIIVTILLQNS